VGTIGGHLPPMGPVLRTGRRPGPTDIRSHLRGPPWRSSCTTGCCCPGWSSTLTRSASSTATTAPRSPSTSAGSSGCRGRCATWASPRRTASRSWPSTATSSWSSGTPPSSAPAWWTRWTCGWPPPSSPTSCATPAPRSSSPTSCSGRSSSRSRKRPASSTWCW